jgi:hypothetical protein
MLCCFPYTNSHLSELTPPDCWTRGLVVLGNGVVDVYQDTRITGLVRAREADQRARTTTTAILNLDLSTRDIELCAARASSAVQSDVFGAKQILARGKRLGEGYRNLCLSCSHIQFTTTIKGQDEQLT